LGVSVLVSAPTLQEQLAPAPTVAPAEGSGITASRVDHSVTPAPASAENWRSGQVMVRLFDSADLDQLSRAYDAPVLSTAGPAGFALLQTPDGLSDRDFVASLQGEPAVQSAARNAVLHGASYDTSTRAHSAQWHLDMVGAPSDGQADLSGVTVAILDSGVSSVSTLSGVALVDEYDFVNDDSDASDDHMHGTHVASVIASSGAVEGVAPGVSLMPLKILDANNEGTELDLLDALAWAGTHGADVINLSVSFSQDYVPSPALRQALQDAADSAVVVGAAGNDGTRVVTWPAAHPDVIAVAAVAQLDRYNDGTLDYSNASPLVDLTAPGGNLDYDDDSDGISDGILGQTIDPSNPSSEQLVLYAGTSQAAAIVSGAAAWLLYEGVATDQVLGVLQSTADEGSDDPFELGFGAGLLQLDSALDSVDDDDDDDDDGLPYAIATLPWAKGSLDKGANPRMTVWVLDAQGGPVEDAVVYAVMLGSHEEFVNCKTNSNGKCKLKPTSKPSYDLDTGAAWSFQVGVVVANDGTAIHPAPIAFASDGLELFLAGRADHGEAAAAPLFGWSWADGSDTLAYSVGNMGTGLVSTPIGVIFTPPFVDTVASVSAAELDLDGTGLVSTPIGFLDIDILSFDLSGTGLVSTPIGIDDPIIFLPGDGDPSAPIDLDGDALLNPNESLASPMGTFAGETIWLDDATCSSCSGTELEGLLSDGGFQDDEGYAGPELLLGAGTFADDLEVVGACSGQGHEAYP
jgi:hypothetical protein